MFERFTEQARRVVQLAQDEARTLGHDHVGTEHVLLGLLREADSLAARALGSVGVTLENARAEVVHLQASSATVTTGQIPFTPPAKKVLELALREALVLDHNYIGPEHILLGVLRQDEDLAAQILRQLGADTTKIRVELIGMLTAAGSPPPSVRSARRRLGDGRQRRRDAGWLDGLDPLLDRLAADIRRDLGRQPDPGDLLLALACAPDTPASRAISELGVDLDALWGTIERARRQQSAEREQLARRIHETAAAKQQALQARQFDHAASLRDQERELREQEHARHGVPADALREARRHLGIPSSPDDPPSRSGNG
jgi:ATP-dependent Clp protease ATP-binding subunit ClpA